GGVGSQGNHGGNLLVESQGDLLFDAQSGSNNGYVQIGHGGGNTGSHNGNLWGDISVRAGGGIRFLAGAGSGANRYAQIGHGGRGNTGNRSGDIEVLSQGSIVFNGGASSRSYAMLGHGGHFDSV